MSSNILTLEDSLLDQMAALYKEEAYSLTLTHYHDEELYLNVVYLAGKLRVEDPCLKELPVRQDLQGYLEEMAQRMGLHVRKVALPQEQDPSKDLTGTLVFDKKTHKSYVVEGSLWAGQRLYDAQTGCFVPYHQENLLTEGFSLYRPFVEKTLSFSGVLKQLLHVVRGEMLLFALFMMVGTLLSLLMPMVMGIVLDFVIPYADFPLLGQIALGLTVLAGLICLGSLGQSGLFIRLKSRGSLYTLSGVWGRVFVLPLSFFRGFTVGDLALRLKGVDLVFQEITVSLISMVSSMAFTVFGVVIIGFYSLPFAGLAFLVGLVYGALFMITAHKQIGFARQMMVFASQIQTRLFQLVKHILKIKITKSEPHTLQTWRKIFLLKMRSTIAYRRFATLFQAGTSFLSVGMTLLVFMFLMNEEALSFGTIVMLLSLYTQLVGSITSWMATLSGFVRFKPYIERVKPILEAPPEGGGSLTLPALKGEISFQNVSFSYGQDALFSQVSFEIPAGCFVALVGASGVGKSTLMKLILGLETPQKGSVLVDQIPLERLDLRSLRRQIGVVLQTPAFIPGSVLENVSMMDASLSLQEVWAALKQARLDADVAALPMGLFTPVSELGKTFSSGQIQRLMIARALVRRPRILLFDEPTSALDNITQGHIVDALVALPMTRILSAHRFSTLEKADEIFVLDEGRVVERGTYAELSRNSRIFNALNQEQRQ